MIDVTKYRGEQVAVLGLGKSGASALRALKAGGAMVVGWDDSVQSREALLTESRPEYVALALHKNLADPASYQWNTIEALVLSPGIPFTHPKPHPVVDAARAAGCPVICDIELLYNSCFRANYIGITGTNGKSTTTSLIGHILKEAKIRTEVGGNLGIPALELDPLASDGTYVLEVSSYQIDLLKETKFNSAVLLNITPDHIDRHGDLAGYIAAKKNIFRNQTAEDTAVISIDNSHTRKIYKELVQEGRIGKIIPISTKERTENGVSIINGILYNDIAPRQGKNAETFTLPPLKHLVGEHNSENIAASFAVCYSYGLKSAKILKAIQSFPGLKHRLQYVAKIDGITFINDSKATNAEAAEKALIAFKNIYWIAGGLPKEGGIDALEHCFPNIAYAFLIGKAADEFAETLQEKVPFSKCGDLLHAFNEAYNMAMDDKENAPVILLSPACASFDQWANFEQRGNAFCAAVAALQQKYQLLF